MIRSYALCFAAVTLRLWMPLLIAGFRMPFEEAYPVIAWLCWVPNLLVAEVIVRRKRPGSIAQPVAARSRKPLKPIS